MVRQSDRFDLYEREFERLKQRAGSMPASKRPRSSIFGARCCSGAACRRSMSASRPDAPVPEGRAPHWRFRLDHDAPIDWTDLIRGPQRFDPKLLSDPVVRREDGSWLYLLPSVIDDIDLGITHIVRGEDHVSNSAAQIQMFEALGAKPPIRARGSARRRGRQIVEAAWVIRRSSICARRASSRWRCFRCWRGSAPRSRSSRCASSTSWRRTSTLRISAARRPISIRTRSS